MSSILFYYYFQIVFFLAFLFIGIKLFLKSNTKEINLVLSVVLILVGGGNLINKFFFQPNLSSQEKYYNDFMNLKVNDIIELSIYADVIKEEPVEKVFLIDSKEEQRKIYKDLIDISPYYVSFESRALKNLFNFEIKTKDQTYLLGLNEFINNKPHLTLYYKSKRGKHKYLVGEFVNNSELLFLKEYTK